ncbi:MAG TPA: hypothetical protein VE955_08310 [Candidatus Dormibacteraeota bacterium]|nr:hypothetical protein [Candidatus Dormibacteraeota bacterium]
MIGVGVSVVSVMVPNWMGGYGFPFAWKNGGCPPPGIAITESCLLAVGVDWLSFGLDVLFYTLILYGLLFAYANRRATLT